MAKLRDIQRVFCLRPWHELAMRGTGEAAICQAQMRGVERGFVKFDDKIVSLETHTAEQILNSEIHKQVRLAQFQGQWHDTCNNCRLKELSSEKKFRIPGSIDDLKECLANLESDGSIKQVEIHRMEVRFSNLCNAACLHCTPVASSRWYDEYHSLFGPSFSHAGGTEWNIDLDQHGRLKPVDFRDPKNNQGIWNTLDNHKNTINHVILSGGEPLLHQEHTKLLDFFIENDRAGSVTLFYHTNLSVIPPGVIDRWKKFSKVQLSVSIDEIGDRYEILRHPLKWNRLESNISKLRENGIDLHGLAICQMIPNMLRLAEIDAWFEKNHYARSFLFVYEKPFVSVNSLPREARLELIEINRSAGTKLNMEAATWIEQQLDIPGDPAACKTFIRFMDHLDVTRNLDWRKLMPELSDFLKRYDIG
jgi:hypothetical protein